MKKINFCVSVALLANVLFTSCEKNNVTDVGVIINGIEWATRNVDVFGVFAPAPESAGKFYQWNREKSWSATDDVTGWDVSDAEGDNWIIENDPCPVGWRVPEIEELKTLLDTAIVACKWTTKNGINGRKFTDKISEKSIFLPAAGYRHILGGTLDGVGSDGYYWSSTPYGEKYVYVLFFGSGSAYTTYGQRSYGYSVRCVAE